jgi:transcriptional regulator with XRE-family HTH domain
MSEQANQKDEKVLLNGETVQNRRRELKLSQEELAHKLKYGQTFWGKVENRKESVPRGDLLRIAMAIDFPGPPWNLLADPTSFQPTLEELSAYLPLAVRKYERVALYGMSGIGKSHTARNHVFDTARVDGYFTLPPLWLKVGLHPDSDSIWANLCRHVGLEPNRGNRDIVRVHDEVEKQGERLLVVADDVWRESFVGELLSMPKSGVIHVLYTARYQGFAGKLARSGLALKVPLLSSDEAVQLLENELNRWKLTREQLSSLAAKLDYLPLSILVAAGYVQTRAEGMGTAAQAIQEILRLPDGGKIVIDYGDQHLPLDRSESGSVNQILDLSYGLLSSDLRDAYHRILSFAPDQLIRVSDLLEFNIAEKSVDQLIDRSLLQQQVEQSERCCRMHDLIRAHARMVKVVES